MTSGLGLGLGLGLGGAYEATIRRIKAQTGDGARLGMAALMWISHSERPLSVDEICHALAVQIGSTDINTNNVPSIRTVLGFCQGLATVDKGSSTIRLIHLTLKEYISRYADLFDNPHSRIAETCLTYLNSQAVRNILACPAHPSRDLQSTPFLKYASVYWGTHMQMELSDHSKDLARDLLNQYDSHISAELLRESIAEWDFNLASPFSGLHCVSYFGIAEAAIDLIKTRRWDVNKRDISGLTPLMWAARSGHENVVKLFLQQKQTKPDMRDRRYGQTALSWASEGGHEKVVELFLSRQSRIGRWRRMRLVISLLFGRKYVNPNRPDYLGQTPVSRAAQNGHEGVVRLLLEREDVTPDKLDNNGRTPLSRAAGGGHSGVVKLLLERKDVSPDRPENNGRTPLSQAAGGGHDGAVKLLLERADVSPDKLDNNGRTPFSWAAQYGCDGVVKLLLEREDVSPDRPDNYGQTPLLLAAVYGHEGVVKLLLEREAVSPDRPNNDSQTPLSLAAQNGSEAVVKLLLEREDVSPDRPDNGGRTPLSLAAENGREEVVKLLLEREDVCPDRPDKFGWTPLSLAALNLNTSIEKLLKARMATTPTMIQALEGTAPFGAS